MSKFVVPSGYLLMCHKASSHYFLIKENDLENRDPAEENVTGIPEHEEKAAKIFESQNNIIALVKEKYPTATPEEIDFILFNITAYPFCTFEALKHQLDESLKETNGNIELMYKYAEKVFQEMCELNKESKELNVEEEKKYDCMIKRVKGSYTVRLLVLKNAIISPKELIESFTKVALFSKTNKTYEHSGSNFKIILKTFGNFSSGQFLIDCEPFINFLKEKSSETKGEN